MADLKQWNMDFKGKYLAANLRGPSAKIALGDLEVHQRE
jgi:hypothetical protein